jgi:hypothetical protein
MNLKNQLICLMASVLCAAPLLRAQSTKQVTVNASVPETLSLTVDATSVTLAFAATDYDAGTGLATKTAVKATTFSVSANRAWKLTVQPGDQFFTFTPAGTSQDPRKPVSALAVRTGAAAFAPFSGVANIPVATGTAGGYTKTGNSVPVDYQMQSALATDPPGAYLLTLTYTLAAQ